jgi:phage terminase large subunit
MLWLFFFCQEGGAMAKKELDSNAIVVDLGAPNSDPQWRFFNSKVRYTCYGGARGGGKSWAIIRKAVLLALYYAGIQILVVRREYDQLENPIIQPMLKLLPPDIRNYNKTEHLLTFINGSKIKFSNMPDYSSTVEGKFQGNNWDVLFIDEATQFLESEFRGLDAIIRGDNGLPKRVYLTCNPGGVGHFWVKRLFVDRKFQGDENPDDYVFIQATVDDNKNIDKEYVNVLNNLPEDVRRAHRYGDWNALSGVFFGEVTEGLHTCKPFPIKPNWKRYRAMDYGLDMHFCIWVAVDETGRCYVYRQFAQANMVVSEAAAKQLELTRPDENISYTIAPPDLWARNRETGKSQAATFAENGVGLLKADNNRKQGWYALKELLKVRDDGKPGLIIFDTCGSLIECLKSLQHDKTDPNDVSKHPHSITHGPDALRYFAQTYVLPAEEEIQQTEDYDDEYGTDYVSYMCGSGISYSYIRA